MHRIVPAVGEHIVTQETLTSRNIAVRVDETAGGGVVVAGLEVVESGLLVRVIALMAKSEAF